VARNGAAANTDLRDDGGEGASRGYDRASVQGAAREIDGRREAMQFLRGGWRSLKAAWVSLPLAALAACSGASGSLPPPPHSPIVLSATSLTFTEETPQSVRVTQPHYERSFVVTDTCAGIARVHWAFNASGSARLIVAPIAKGTCTVRIAGGGGASAAIAVSVRPNPVVVAPSSLAFAAAGKSNAKTAVVSQAGYRGRFTGAGDCRTIAAIVASNAGSGRSTYAITPLGEGACTASFAGGLKESAALSIRVMLPGDVVVTPSWLAFTATGPGAAASIEVAQQSYGGKFIESNDCAGIATVAAGRNDGGNATFDVTPLAKGDCKATFTGGAQASSTIPITVAPHGTVEVSPWALDFTQTHPSAARKVNVAQAGYRGKFSKSSNCAGIAKIATLQNFSGKATYEVEPLAKGACRAIFTGGNGESAQLVIAVRPPGSVVISPSSLTFTETGSGAAQGVTVSQHRYHGTYTESDDCAGIATVTAAGTTHGVAPYVVTPLTKGSCSAIFEGGNRERARLRIGVTPPDAVVLAPSSLSFTATGSGAAQNVAVSQNSYGGTFTESDDCSGIATVAGLSNSGGKATFAVTPVGMGSCSATYTGGNKASAALPIDVALPGNVVVNPASLTLNATGSGAAVPVAVSQQGYGGSFTESDTCASVATVVATSNANGKASFLVTPEKAGNCTATFAGGNRESVPLPITVAPFGSVVVAPKSMTFTATGSGAAKNAAVSQGNFTGSFTETDSCSGTASVKATTNSGGNALYSVTPIARGTCTATFTGGGKASAPLAIQVTPYGNVVVTPSSMTFDATGSGAARKALVTQSNYRGSFTESDDCSGTATVAAGPNAGGKATYTVTARAEGSCTAIFTGGNDNAAPLSIVVNLPGGVVASPAPVAFYATGSAQGVTVTVTQPSYSGTFGETDTCTGVATVVELSNAGGIAQYRVTPLAAGACAAIFTGGNNETYTLHVSVTLTKVGVNGRRRH
jgi:hypothetical protein